MKLLLVAYDFPPIPSPQALRWAYLARELALAGHDVEVIAPDLPGYGPGGLPVLPATVIVHRVDPGKLSRLLMGRQRSIAVEPPAQTAAAAEATPAMPAPQFEATPVLNWKGRTRRRVERAIGIVGGLNWKGALAEKVKTLVSDRVFPDYRVEWVASAVAKLEEVARQRPPDVVVVSHEPACSLPVGLAAAKRGMVLAVDMGDPVLAPYTPAKWRKKAFALERDVCKAASFVSVTTEAAAQLLIQRHALASERVAVVRQGFDCAFKVEQELALEFDPQRLELLYTGSFYSFRRAEDILTAVSAVPGVRLTVATISAPDYLVKAAEDSPQSIRIIGFMPHRAALAAQRACDVLVNLANADPVQVPGKVFEYLGAGKPILHLRGEQQDATGQILARLGAGWELPANAGGPLSTLLQQMKELKSAGQLHTHAPARAAVYEYSWRNLAAAWADQMQGVLERDGEQGRAHV
ncbi:glycosyltransferase [Stenotrophomonas sp. PS02298]|uniref:glycosyltransferase n=1 Tax=Stenotrophomonas sp. PS02298 TaxID=2991424 RepID=UPI00249CC48A|nr:glycosyltransferase [Stenotrophomonas sp. PS02298]